MIKRERGEKGKREREKEGRIMKENTPLHLTPTASATMPPPGPGTWMLLSIVAQLTLEFRVGYIPAPV